MSIPEKEGVRLDGYLQELEDGERAAKKWAARQATAGENPDFYKETEELRDEVERRLGEGQTPEQIMDEMSVEEPIEIPADVVGPY